MFNNNVPSPVLAGTNQNGTPPTNSGLVAPVARQGYNSASFQTPLHPTTPKPIGQASSSLHHGMNIENTPPQPGSGGVINLQTPPSGNIIGGNPGMMQPTINGMIQANPNQYPYYSTTSVGSQQVIGGGAAVNYPQLMVGSISNQPQPKENNAAVMVAPTEMEPTVPDTHIVFSCKHCRSILIDNNALMYSNDEFNILSFHRVYRVEVRDNVQIAPSDRFDAGSNYLPIFCKLCQANVGKKYTMSDKSPIVDILHLYTLDLDSLSSYELWSPENDNEKNDGHVDNAMVMKRFPTLPNISTQLVSVQKAMLQQKDTTEKLREELINQSHLIHHIPQILKELEMKAKKIDEMENEVKKMKDEQSKLINKSRRLNMDLDHVKKEKGVTPLGKEVSTTQGTDQQPKKRTSTSSNQEHPTPPGVQKKKKTNP